MSLTHSAFLVLDHLPIGLNLHLARRNNGAVDTRQSAPNAKQADEHGYAQETEGNRHAAGPARLPGTATRVPCVRHPAFLFFSIAAIIDFKT